MKEQNPKQTKITSLIPRIAYFFVQFGPKFGQGKGYVKIRAQDVVLQK